MKIGGAIMVLAGLILVVVAVPRWRSEQVVGDPVTLNKIAFEYYRGQGVEKDYAKARDYFEQAADQGYAPAQVNLGIMYDHGDGVPRDYGKAVKWYRRAAEQGDVNGRQMLGYMYFYGLGVKQDAHVAMTYFAAAASEIPQSEPLLSQYRSTNATGSMP